MSNHIEKMIKVVLVDAPNDIQTAMMYVDIHRKSLTDPELIDLARYPSNLPKAVFDALLPNKSWVEQKKIMYDNIISGIANNLEQNFHEKMEQSINTALALNMIDYAQMLRKHQDEVSKDIDAMGMGGMARASIYEEHLKNWGNDGWLQDAREELESSQAPKIDEVAVQNAIDDYFGDVF